MQKEYRSAQIEELREDGEEGIIHAYLTRWGVEDSYRSRFERGAFTRSIAERGPSGIRLFWDHESLAGRTLSLIEDDQGPLGIGRFNLRTDAGRTAWEHVRAGDVSGVSFGFFVRSDRMEEGVRVISDVDVLEWGPVIFPANPRADIVAVREAAAVDIEGLAAGLVRLQQTIRGDAA